MISLNYAEDLDLLRNALRNEGFRFILIDHNRHSLYNDLAQWTRDTFPDRKIEELRFGGKNYRQIIDSLNEIENGIVLIPDFDWLFQEGNGRINQAFNQRRDYLAQKPLALICFLQPSNFRVLPVKLPDWWSLRSMEIELRRDEVDFKGKLLSMDRENSSLGGLTKEEKEAEIHRLSHQLESTDLNNHRLIQNLVYQLGVLFFEISEYDLSLSFMERSLQLNQKIGDSSGEATDLNQIGEIHFNKGVFERANHFFQLSLQIRKEIGDRIGEGESLNNISQIFYKKADYDEALKYLEQSLSLQQEIYDRSGEWTTLNNIGEVKASMHQYTIALELLNKSLGIVREIGNSFGEGAVLNNISQIYSALGEYEKELSYLEESLKIRQRIGDLKGIAECYHNIGAFYFRVERFEEAIPFFRYAYNIFNLLNIPGIKVTDGFFNNIKSQIGEARFNEIVSQIEKEQSEENSDE